MTKKKLKSSMYQPSCKKCLLQTIKNKEKAMNSIQIGAANK